MSCAMSNGSRRNGADSSESAPLVRDIDVCVLLQRAPRRYALAMRVL